MIAVQRSVLIALEVEDVWQFIHDPANGPLWQTSVLEAETAGGGPMGVGTRGREVRSFLGRRFATTAEIVEFDRPRRSAVRVISGPVPGASTYAFEPVGSAAAATRLTVTLELEGRAFRLAGPLVARAVRRELDGNLAALKRLLEVPLARHVRAGGERRGVDLGGQGLELTEVTTA